MSWAEIQRSYTDEEDDSCDEERVEEEPVAGFYRHGDNMKPLNSDLEAFDDDEEYTRAVYHTSG